MAVGFRRGDAVSVGAAAGWSVGVDDPHPARTISTLNYKGNYSQQDNELSHFTPPVWP